MNENNVIEAEVFYDELYRFRIWKALLDDFNRYNDVGIRKYLSLISSYFQSWEAQGYIICDHKKVPINLQNLSYMDLHRFMGRDSDKLAGPGIELSFPKLQVLDTYLKTKYPELSASFKIDDLTHEFAMMHLKMFSASDSQNFIEEVLGGPPFGLYVPFNKLSKDYVSERVEKNIVTPFPILRFSSFGKNNYAIMHRIECDVIFKKGLLVEDEYHYDGRDRIHIALVEEPKKLYSGILYESNVLADPNFELWRQYSFSLVSRENVFRTNRSSSILHKQSIVPMDGPAHSYVYEYFGTYEDEIYIEASGNKVMESTSFEYLYDASQLTDIYDMLGNMRESM